MLCSCNRNINLTITFSFLLKALDDPTVDAHIWSVGFHKNQEPMTSSGKWGMFLKSSPDSKADLSKRVTIKCTEVHIR